MYSFNKQKIILSESVFVSWNNAPCLLANPDPNQGVEVEPEDYDVSIVVNGKYDTDRRCTVIMEQFTCDVNFDNVERDIFEKDVSLHVGTDQSIFDLDNLDIIDSTTLFGFFNRSVEGFINDDYGISIVELYV